MSIIYVLIHATMVIQFKNSSVEQARACENTIAGDQPNFTPPQLIAAYEDALRQGTSEQC
jgi:hypothetical protein